VTTPPQVRAQRQRDLPDATPVVIGAPIFCSGRNFARSSYLAPSVVRHRATILRLLPGSYSTTAIKSIPMRSAPVAYPAVRDSGPQDNLSL
jgi:hypothetical protein